MATSAPKNRIITFLFENSIFLIAGAFGALLWANVDHDSYHHLVHLKLFEDTLFGTLKPDGTRVFDLHYLQLIDPPSVETLAVSEEKTYAARSIVHLNDNWVSDYLAREVLYIDTAEKARSVLLAEALVRYGTLSDLLVALANNPASAIPIESLDSRLKRVRRILDALGRLGGTVAR